MSSDPTELPRRLRQAELNSAQAEREQLETKYGQVWDTSQLCEDFDVKGFMAPFVIATRKKDGVLGSLLFQHHPRYYFEFQPDSK